MNFVTSVFKKYIKNESNSTDNGKRKEVSGELPASTTANQTPESLNKSDEEDFQDAETNATTSTSSGDPQQTISSSNIQSPEISQQEKRFSSTCAIIEPDSLDTSIIDSLDGLQQTDKNFDESNLIDSIEIPHLIDGIKEYEQGLEDPERYSTELITSSKQQEQPLSERNEMLISGNLEETSREGALEQLIRSVNETLVLNDSSLNNVLIKDIQPDLQIKKELNHNSDTTAVVSDPEKLSSREPNKSNKTPDNSLLQQLSNEILCESQTIQPNLDHFSGRNSSTEIDDENCAPQPTTAQEKPSTIFNNLTESNDVITTDDHNESNKNVVEKTGQELASDNTDIAYERQETKEFEKLEQLAGNSEETSSFKLEIDDILDYLVAKSTSPTHESKQELPDQKLNKEPSTETVSPDLLLQEIATIPLPDDSPLETNKTFFRQDTGEFEAIEKLCLLEEKTLSGVPEESSSKTEEGEAVEQINELKLISKNCEETKISVETLSTGDVLEETKTKGAAQSEAILLDLMAEKFSVPQVESKTPLHEEGKTLCRQDTHEFEIMEKQCMLEAQKEQNSEKLDKVSEILEEDVNKKEDCVNDSSSSSADTVIAVNENTKTGVKDEVIQHKEEQLEKIFLNKKTLIEEASSAGNNSQIEEFTKLYVASETLEKACEKKISAEINDSIKTQKIKPDDQKNKVSENPQVEENNSATLVKEDIVAALNSVVDISTSNNQLTEIQKDSKSQDEVILKKSNVLLDEGKPSSFSNNSSVATVDEQQIINDKETLISSDNNFFNDKLDEPSTKSKIVRLENGENHEDSREKPVKPQFNKQNRKSETRNKAEVRPTVRPNKPIPTQKNDNISKDGHKDSAAKVTNNSQCDETNIVSKMKQMLIEYDKQISMQAAELERLRNEAEMNVRHFTNTEMAFSDVFEKYEKSKAVIAVYRRNEDILLENIERAEEQIIQLESKCQAMKQQSMTEIRRAEYQVNQEKEKYKRDISKMQGQIKRLEIKASSLELALKQKNDECQALAALCDDITGRTTDE